MSVPKLISFFRITCRNRVFSRFMPQDCEFEWEVPLEDTSVNVNHSSVFPKDSNGQFKWEVVVVSCSGSLSFFLYLSEKRICELDVYAECSFFIKTEYGSKIMDRKGIKLTHERWGFHLHGCHELTSKIGRIPLIFGVQVSARYDITLIIVERIMREKTNYYSVKNFKLGHVILPTEKDGAEFKVNRFMLASRSTVFAAIFSTKVKEDVAAIFNIQKFSGYIMRYLLHFIDSDTLNFPGFNIALKLLEAAEYFNLKDLKNRCAKYLLGFIDVGHACEVLLNAHLFCVEDLKEISLEFIRLHQRELVNTDDYKTFPKALLLDIEHFQRKGVQKKSNRRKL